MMISLHTEHCVNRWAGDKNSYEPIHMFLDLTKIYVSDWRHRLLLHNTLGVCLVDHIFKEDIQGKNYKVSPRTVAEHHILEDLGAVPSTRWNLRDIKVKPLDLSIYKNALEYFFTKPEQEFLLLFYYQALDKSQIYYTTLGLELLSYKFDLVPNLPRYVEGFKAISQKQDLLTPSHYLNSIPVSRWMGGLTSRQIKYLQKTLVV